MIDRACRRKGACAGARTFGAQGAQNAGTCQREHGRFSAVHRQCPGILRTRSKFLHVIARSGAMGQSVTPAVRRGRKQYFGRICSFYEFARSSTSLPGFPAGRTDCRRCAHWFAMTILVGVCAPVRNDRPGRCVRTWYAPFFTFSVFFPVRSKGSIPNDMQKLAALPLL